MGTAEEKLARLRKFNAGVSQTDPKLREETVQTEAVQTGTPPTSIDSAIAEESIILRRERPVLAISHNETKLDFKDSVDSEIWGSRLKLAKPVLDKAIRAVGRIELKGGSLDWVGTGWLVADNILVTNRHVANEFAARKGEGFDFKIGDGGKISYFASAQEDRDSAVWAASSWSISVALRGWQRYRVDNRSRVTGSQMPTRAKSAVVAMYQDIAT